MKVTVLQAALNADWCEDLEVEFDPGGFYTVSGSMFIGNKKDLKEFTDYMTQLLKESGLDK